MAKSNYKSLGILGGSFDPPHHGHLRLCEIALKKLKLSKIFWVVTKKNPFKKKVFFSLKKRLHESKKITKGNKKIKVIYIDKKIGSSRTINVVEYLRKIIKTNKIYLLIGSDNLVKFHKWKDYEKIIDFCHIVVFSRRGYDKMARKSAIMKSVKNKKIKFMRNKKFNISSTIIRKYYNNQ